MKNKSKLITTLIGSLSGIALPIAIPSANVIANTISNNVTAIQDIWDEDPTLHALFWKDKVWSYDDNVITEFQGGIPFSKLNEGYGNYQRDISTQFLQNQQTKYDTKTRDNDYHALLVRTEVIINVPAHTDETEFEIDVLMRTETDAIPSGCGYRVRHTQEMFDLGDDPEAHPEFLNDSFHPNPNKDKYSLGCNQIWHKTDTAIGVNNFDDAFARTIKYKVSNPTDHAIEVKKYLMFSVTTNGDQNKFGDIGSSTKIVFTQRNNCESPFQKDSWANLCKVASEGVKALHKYYEYDCNHNSEMPGTLIGLTKKFIYKGIEHTVRVVGEGQDIIAEGPRKGQKAGLTFEMTTLLAKDQNKIMEVEFNKFPLEHFNKYDYVNSSLRKVLTGQGSGKKPWKTEPIIADEIARVNGINFLKVEKRTTNCNNESVGDKFYDLFSDTLFPLSPDEMGCGMYRYRDGSTYTYFVFHSDKKFMKKGHPLGGSYGEYSCWLRSHEDQISKRGDIVAADDLNDTNGISFAFCI